VPHRGEAVRWRHGRSAAGAETRGDSGELRPLHLRVPMRELVEGLVCYERKGEREERIYIAPRTSSETMRSVMPRATPRQTVLLPRFLLPLSVLAPGDPSLFLLASLPLLAFLSPTLPPRSILRFFLFPARGSSRSRQLLPILKRAYGCAYKQIPLLDKFIFLEEKKKKKRKTKEEKEKKKEKKKNRPPSDPSVKNGKERNS